MIKILSNTQKKFLFRNPTYCISAYLMLFSKSTVKPKINTERFKGTFINRLVFSNLGIF